MRLVLGWLLVFAILPAPELRKFQDQSTVELTSRGRKSGQLRTVTIWFVHDDGKIYLQSGRGGKTDWYRNVEKSPEVTLAFRDTRIRSRATPVEDPAEQKRIHALFQQKYWLAWLGQWVGLGFGSGRVVRVEPVD